MKALDLISQGIDNVPQRHKTNLLAGVPTALALFLGIHQFSDRVGTALDMDASADRIHTSQALSSFAHELQKERGISVSVVGDTTGKWVATLNQQRGESVSVQQKAEKTIHHYENQEGNATVFLEITGTISRLLQKISSSENKDSFDLSAIPEILKELESLRSQVDTKALPSVEVGKQYTRIIGKLLQIADSVYVGTERIDTVLTANKYLNQAKESLGQERANTMVAYTTGSASAEVMSAIGKRQILIENALAEFSKKASPQLRQQIQETFQSDTFKKIQEVREAVKAGNFDDLTGVEVYNRFTDGINVLNELLKASNEHVASEAQTVSENAEKSAKLYLFSMLLALGATLSLVITLNRKSNNDFTSIKDSLAQLAEGDLDTIFSGNFERKDEIGTIFRAIKSLQEALQQARTDRALSAEKDLENKRKTRETLFVIADSLDAIIDKIFPNLESLAGGARKIASELKNSAQTTVGELTSVSASLEQVSMNTQTIAAASEEMLAANSEITSQINRAEQRAHEAVEKARVLVSLLDALKVSGGKIQDVTKDISEIAAQTSLLGLNATIESSRVGEAGKGFAVVANEVKNLANTSARSAEEAGKDVQAMLQEITRVSAGVSEIQNVIQGVSEMTTAIVSATQEQEAALEEIARNMQDSANSVADIADRNKHVLEDAQKTEAGSEKILGAAQEIVQTLQNARAQLKTHIEGIREQAREIK